MAVWDYKTVVVYKIDSRDSRMSVEPAGSFNSNTRFLCLFGLNVYTVEPGRIHVRNFQVDGPTLLGCCLLCLPVLMDRTAFFDIPVINIPNGLLASEIRLYENAHIHLAFWF